MDGPPVPQAAPGSDAFLNGLPSNLGDISGGNDASKAELEKIQRKEQVMARREELRQKNVGADSAVSFSPAPPVIAQTPIVSAPASAIREDQVRGAVDFLTHPRVVASDPDKKRRFLKSKGLTDEEIEEAFRRAGSLCCTKPRRRDLASLTQPF